MKEHHHHENSFLSKIFNKIFRADKKNVSTLELNRTKENLDVPPFKKYGTLTSTQIKETKDFSFIKNKNKNGLSRKISKSIPNFQVFDNEGDKNNEFMLKDSSVQSKKSNTSTIPETNDSQILTHVQTPSLSSQKQTLSPVSPTKQVTSIPDSPVSKFSNKDDIS